jgi:hypothetical protein
MHNDRRVLEVLMYQNRDTGKVFLPSDLVERSERIPLVLVQEISAAVALLKVLVFVYRVFLVS